MHLTLVPYIETAGEIKTKPTQHSVAELRSIGIQPDFLICRAHNRIGEEARRKIALFCNLPPEHVIDGQDVRSIYEVPLNYHRQGFDDLLCKRLAIEPPQAADLSEWERMTRIIVDPPEVVKIAIVGKYVELKDAYKSIIESFMHAGIPNRVGVEQVWVDAETLEGSEIGDARWRRSSATATASWCRAASATAASRARSRRSATRASRASRSSASASACSAR